MSEKYKKEDFEKIIERLRGQKGADLSLAEDLSLAVMNLISLEEHFFFTAEKTGKVDYFEISKEIREIRKGAMERLVDKHEGETWCATKHLLAGTMRLIEVANRFQADSKKNEAKEMYDRAYRLYSVFWALRLKLISVDKSPESEEKNKEWGIEDITNKLADCCSE